MGVGTTGIATGETAGPSFGGVGVATLHIAHALRKNAVVTESATTRRFWNAGPRSDSETVFRRGRRSSASDCGRIALMRSRLNNASTCLLRCSRGSDPAIDSSVAETARAVDGRKDGSFDKSALMVSASACGTCIKGGAGLRRTASSVASSVWASKGERPMMAS